ncbi:MAG: hypothetical protein IIA70_04080 [Proteobacteria bacterium]|nr:hypothetical protein [Pseudomonadota bacterium]
MAERIGRTFKVKKGGTVIAGLRTKTLTWNGEGINISTDDDSGFRTFLKDVEGEQQIDVPVDGIYKSSVFRNIALAPGTTKFLTDITLEDEVTLETLSGDFKLANYEEGIPYNEAVTFSASLQSSGQWVFTPEA